MPRKSKVRIELEERVATLERENSTLRELNATQLQRLTGDELLRIRISELETSLNDVTDELVDTKAQRDKLVKELEAVRTGRMALR